MAGSRVAVHAEAIGTTRLKHVKRAVTGEVTPAGRRRLILGRLSLIDKVHDAFAGQQAELLETSLSSEDESCLRASAEV